MRITLALGLIAGLSVCSAPPVGPAGPDVDVATDRETYQIGSTGILEVSNPGSGGVLVHLAGTEPSFCSVALVQRKDEDDWVSHPDECVRQAILAYEPLESGEKIDVGFSVPGAVFQPGTTYRFVVTASEGSGAPAYAYYSNAFSVID